MLLAAAQTCAQSEFACGTNGTCIPTKWRCDKELDCEHGEDEKNCEGKQFMEISMLALKLKLKCNNK